MFSGKRSGDVGNPWAGFLFVLEIGADYVLGRWLDEMEVEHIRVYRLSRGPTGAG